MRRHATIAFSTLIFILAALTTLAAPPKLITVQGKVTDAAGAPLPAGIKSFAFRIFDASSGGTQIWPSVGTEGQNLTTNADGLWSGALGAVNSLTDAVFADSVRWLEITVEGQTLPRVRLVTGPYAMRVATVDGAESGQINGTLDINGGVFWGGGAVAPYSRSDIDATGLFIEHVGNSSANDNVRIQSSTNGGLTNYSQLIVDPASGFFFTATGSARDEVAIGSPNGGVKLSVYTTGQYAFMADANNATNAVGVYGRADGPQGLAVWAVSAGGGRAGEFYGNVNVGGTLTKDAGSFKIDHPLDPANKYLSHSFVESPDMMNIYNGNATLDAKGEATVSLPDWFGALNKDFRYQLTAIGAPGPNLYVAQKVTQNQFRIAGGSPGMEVSWQITGIRQDAYANAHRIPVEEAKSEKERGYYRHPDLFSQPEEKQLDWARHPEMMKQMKDKREKAKAEGTSE